MERSTPGKEKLLAMLFIACIAGCATGESHEIARPKFDPQSVDTEFPPQALSLSAATALSASYKLEFQSASMLVSQRPRVRQEIAELELGVIAGDGNVENRSRMRFFQLATGLDYFLHSRPGFMESGVDLFGTGTLVYWNSRFPNLDGTNRTAPDQIRLVDGRLYSGDSPFTLEIKRSDDVTTDECKPSERVSAKTIHDKLRGHATIYQCKNSFGTSSKLWFLEDYARYVTQAVYDDEGFLSRFTVKDVKFSD